MSRGFQDYQFVGVGPIRISGKTGLSSAGLEDQSTLLALPVTERKDWQAVFP
jgi:hypothetical protein